MQSYIKKIKKNKINITHIICVICLHQFPPIFESTPQNQFHSQRKSTALKFGIGFGSAERYERYEGAEGETSLISWS